MSIEHRLKQMADAVDQSVQDVDVVARLHELPKRQRARSARAALVALMIFAGALVPVLVGPLRDRVIGRPAASLTSLPSATGVTVQILNDDPAGSLAAGVRSAGYDVVDANTDPVVSYELSGGYWSDKIDVSVFLAAEISPAERESIGDQLRFQPVVERVDHESKQQAAERFNASPEMARNVTADTLPESYRVKLKDPTKVAQIHDLFCSGRLNDRGREICNPGIRAVLEQTKLKGSRIYYTKGHLADAKGFRARFPDFQTIAKAPPHLSPHVALHVVIDQNHTQPTTDGCLVPVFHLWC
jgi:hypothetical protein